MLPTIATKEEFAKFVEDIKESNIYKKPLGFGIARVDRGQKNPDKILQAVFPVVNWDENFGSAAVFLKALDECGFEFDKNESEAVFEITRDFVDSSLNAFAPFLTEAKGKAHKNVQIIKYLDNVIDIEPSRYKIVFIFEDEAPKTVESVYLKLYALSLGKAPLRGVNLNGAFGILTNVAWSGNTPIELEWLRENELELKLSGKYPVIDSVDKFPRFLQHIIPADNTRILDASKVRFGAQLAAGTTVMPGASYINFNAGTLGPVMVEGRISSSAVVGKGSDIGGGASILGVLSGTSGNPISIGENCLLGANSVTGIPLGDGCIVDAGIAVLEGTKFFMSETEFNKIKETNPKWKAEYKEIFKGKELAGLNGLHFRQDSTTGVMKVFRSNKEVKLNEALH
jgi:2,3,4,5-tetrahydropyridine-2-carboxylate N-succinyltransferase